MSRRLVFALPAILVLAGCAHATPVAPAPLGKTQAGQLRCDLLGTWEHMDIDGKPMRDMRITWQFKADGTGVYSQTPMGPLPLPGGHHGFRWHLEGRNLVLQNGRSKTVYRADHWDAGRMQWFNYRLSDHYGVRRVGASPSCN